MAISELLAETAGKRRCFFKLQIYSYSALCQSLNFHYEQNSFIEGYILETFLADLNVSLTASFFILLSYVDFDLLNQLG